MEHQLIVQDIFIYPIKSLGGIRLEEGVVEERGFQFDRRWMLVDREGNFITQREFPQLALLGVKIEENQIIIFHKNQKYSSLSFSALEAKGPEILVRIWDDQVIGKVVDPKIDQWFSDFLGFETHLVFMPKTTERKVDPRYSVNDESVSFADGMPYLLISQESLDELNSRLDTPISMERFRPNIVMSGGEAFQEDQLKRIKIGDVAFQIVKPCARCVLITIDPENGDKGKEPLKTLSTYRTQNNKVYFGQNVVSLQSGKIRVGDIISY